MYLLGDEQTIRCHASIPIPSVAIVVATVVTIVSTRPAILIACCFAVGSFFPDSMRGGAAVRAEVVVPIHPIAIGGDHRSHLLCER